MLPYSWTFQACGYLSRCRPTSMASKTNLHLYMRKRGLIIRSTIVLPARFRPEKRMKYAHETFHACATCRSRALETGTQTITFIFLDYEERSESLWEKIQKKTAEAVQWSRVVTALAPLIMWSRQDRNIIINIQVSSDRSRSCKFDSSGYEVTVLSSMYLDRR